LPGFVDTTAAQIENRLRELQDEVSRLEAARSALTGGPRRPGRPRAAAARTTRSRPARRATRQPRRSSTRRGGGTRAVQTLELVRSQPGITIPELAKAMKIQPNYLYRVLPRLASQGQLRRDGQGWHVKR
jgi:CRP-like cAMP-binding protein